MAASTPVAAPASAAAVGAPATGPVATGAAAAKQIKQIKSETASLPGYLHSSTAQLTKSFQTFATTRGVSGASGPKWSHPGLWGDLAVLGTEDPDAQFHSLALINTKTLINSLADPVLLMAQTDQHVRDIRWLQASTIVCAAGKGLIQRWSVTDTSAKASSNSSSSAQAASAPPQYQLKCLDAKVPPVHSDFIRELAPSPTCVTKLASGGFDKVVHIVDVEDSLRSVRNIPVDDVVGSLRWTKYLAGHSVSCTQDDGKLFVFDLRAASTGPSDAAVRFDSAKLDLYAHEHYAEHRILLGYADGELKELDLRNSRRPLSCFQDPFVDAIGNIALSPTGNSFVVSGFTDFSVWRCDQSTLQVWSHSSSFPLALKNSSGNTFNAAYLSDTTVLAACSNGAVQAAVQRFS